MNFEHNNNTVRKCDIPKTALKCMLCNQAYQTATSTNLQCCVYNDTAGESAIFLSLKTIMQRAGTL